MQQRRSSSTSALRTQRSAKQTLSSSRGFAGPVRKVHAASGVLQRISELQLPSEAAAAEEETSGARAQEAEVETPRDVCAICLEGLDDNGFAFPCGQDHRMHYRCTLSFMASILSLPVAEDRPGPLTKKDVRDMGVGFKAISVVEDAIRRAAPETMCRLCCPLCRSAWPAEDVTPLNALVEQLRECRAKSLGESIRKMDEAFSEIKDRFDQRDEVQLARMTHGFIVLDDNFHSASSFLAKQLDDDRSLLKVLSFMETKATTSLCTASVTCSRLCRRDSKLRACHVRSGKIRAATHYIWAADVISVEINASWSSHSPMSRGATGLDAVAFVKWLRDTTVLEELTLNSVQWEKVDPGSLSLGSAISSHRLRILDLSQNLIVDSSLQNLAKVMMANPSSLQFLEILTFNLNCITEVGLAAVLPLGSRAGSRVCDWGFRHNKVGDGACKIIAQVFDPEFLEKGPRLDCWDLRTNGIGLEGCKALAPSVFGEMVVARLGCNPLGDSGVEALADGIGPKLRVLDLRQGQLGDAAAIALGCRLQNSPVLEELLLSGNDIGAMGARALADGWANNACLHFVDLAGNSSIGSMGVALIAEEMPIWKQAPFRLSLAGVSCEEDGAKKLISMLSANPRGGRGWVIELQNNPIGSASYILEVRRLLEETSRVPSKDKDATESDDESGE